jgi:hypothetical protein
METNYQEMYSGFRLIAVPEKHIQGLKVVDRDGSLGVITIVTIISSREKDNPDRTIYIQINWKNKGAVTYYHWQLGWVVIGDKPGMAAVPTLTPLPPDTIPPKSSFFGSIKESIAKLFR